MFIVFQLKSRPKVTTCTVSAKFKTPRSTHRSLSFLRHLALRYLTNGSFEKVYIWCTDFLTNTQLDIKWSKVKVIKAYKGNKTITDEWMVIPSLNSGAKCFFVLSLSLQMHHRRRSRLLGKNAVQLAAVQVSLVCLSGGTQAGVIVC